MKNKIYPKIEVLKEDALKLGKMWLSIQPVVDHAKCVISEIRDTASSSCKNYMEEADIFLWSICSDLERCEARLMNTYGECAENYEEYFPKAIIKKNVDKEIKKLKTSTVCKVAKMVKKSGRIFEYTELKNSFRPRRVLRYIARDAVNELFCLTTANLLGLTVEALPCSSKDGRITYKHFIGTHKAFEEQAGTDFTSK